MLRKDTIRPLDGARRTADPSEIARFDRLADEWWKSKGKFKVVHEFNAARVDHICRLISDRLSHGRGLSGLSILDVGCGAGLVAEPLARDDAQVTAIDASAQNVEIAKRHAIKTGLQIDYRCATPEEIVSRRDGFDVVLSLEVVEHVADLPAFNATASLLRPGGLLIIGTLNRTIRSWMLAIVGAEYIFRWLPRGTHDWNKFVKPQELISNLGPLGFVEIEKTGVMLNPLTWKWAIGANSAVNYLQLFALEERTR